MRDLRLLPIAFAILLVGLFAQPQQDAHAAFHIMRVYNVMGGAYGSTIYQYVELRMPSPGQNFVSTHEICFYDSSGTAKARFSFLANAASGLDNDSILVGTSEFDAVWPAGALGANFTFSGTNTTSLNSGDNLHPVQLGGRVSFGDFDASCGTPSVIDSAAYAASGTVTADFGTRFGSDLPTTGTQALKLTGTFCHPSEPTTCPRDNSADYSLVDANVTANNPRNNAGQSGPLSVDTDQDGVDDGTDNCMTTANAFQGNQDADGQGDACDSDSDGDTVPNATDPDDDDDKVYDADEGECRDDVDSADANTLVNDGCPAVGAAESGGQCTSATDSDADGYINDGCPGSSEIDACGGDPLSPSRRPERIDGTFASTDDDADGSMNEALPVGSSGFDCDGDGWPGNQENLVYDDAPSTTRDQDPCGNNGWAADLDPDNKVNIGDINSFTSPARMTNDGHGVFNKFGHPLDDTLPFATSVDAAMARWNLDTPPHMPTTVIDIGDLNAINPGVSAPTARPPMLGGLPAFFTSGGQCPWPA